MPIFRYLTLILFEFVDTKNGDKHWIALMQLQTITDTAFAPKLTNSLLNYFSHCRNISYCLKKLYPNLHIKPKQNYLVHFKTMVQTNRPPTLNSFFKYELRNIFKRSFFKRARVSFRSHISATLKIFRKLLCIVINWLPYVILF